MTDDIFFAILSIMKKLFFIIFFTVLFLAVIKIILLITYSRIIEESYEIASINREKDIHGSFFLGIGDINSISYYYFYKKTKIGNYDSKGMYNKKELIGLYAYNLKKIPVFSRTPITIIESDIETPRIIEKLETCCWNEKRLLSATIYVPMGTIIKKFELK